MRVAQFPPPPRFEATIAATPDHVRALEAALVAARAGEKRFRGLVESIQAIPYIANWDEPGTILYISPQVAGDARARRGRQTVLLARRDVRHHAAQDGRGAADGGGGRAAGRARPRAALL